MRNKRKNNNNIKTKEAIKQQNIRNETNGKQNKEKRNNEN